MSNHVARTGAIRSYISLFRREEDRLNGVKGSPRANQQDREDAETGLSAAALKISHADQELRGLEAWPVGACPKKPGPTAH
jgi:hypothetical protein